MHICTARLLHLVFLLHSPLIALAQDDTLRTIDEPEVVVTALRTPVVHGNVPYALSTARLPEGTPGVSLGELLRSVPGVQIQNRFNGAVGERITIRGFGARSQFGVRGIRVVLDGLPMTFADGQSALEGIDIPMVTRAEVIRGPASALYGNASGGVILLTSLPFSSSPFELSTTVTGNSNELLRAGGRISGSDGVIGYSASYSDLNDPGFRDHSRSRAQRASTTIAYDIDEQSRLSLGAGWTSFDAENPGSLTRALADENPLQAFAGNVRQKTGKSGSQIETSGGWRYRGTTGGAVLHGHFIGRSITNPIPDRIIQIERSSGGIRAMFDGGIDLGANRLGWNAGADVDFQSDDRRNHANQSGERGALLLDQEEEVLSIGPYLQVSLPLTDQLLVMGSARYDRVAFRVSDRFIDTADPDDSGERIMDAISPSLGVVWRASPTLNLYTNLSTAFETPTTTELANRPDGAGGFNPALSPQRTLSLEAGARGSVAALLDYNLAIYNADVSDALIPFQVPGVPGRDFYRNVGTAVHRGAELAVTLYPIESTILSMSWSYTDARFGEDLTSETELEGNSLPGVARNRLTAELSRNIADIVQLRLQGRYSSGEFGNDANTEKIPGHFLLDLGAALSPWEIFPSGAWSCRLAVAAGVENLFDTPYFASTAVNAFGGRYYEPGAGRVFYLRLSLSPGPSPIPPAGGLGEGGRGS